MITSFIYISSQAKHPICPFQLLQIPSLAETWVCGCVLDDMLINRSRKKKKILGT